MAKQQHGLGRGLGALIPETIPGIQEIGNAGMADPVPRGKARLPWDHDRDIDPREGREPESVGDGDVGNEAGCLDGRRARWRW